VEYNDCMQSMPNLGGLCRIFFDHSCLLRVSLMAFYHIIEGKKDMYDT